MRTPEEQERFLQSQRFGETPDTPAEGPFTRLVFAAFGLVAGDAALFLFLLPKATGAFILYAIVSLLGWIVVGVPIALLLPARVILRLSWLVTLLAGAALGALALFLIAFVLTALEGRFSTFSLAHTESLWPVSILVSTISFLTYRALLAFAKPGNLG